MPFVPEALKSRDVCPGFPCVDVDSESNRFQTAFGKTL